MEASLTEAPRLSGWEYQMYSRKMIRNVTFEYWLDDGWYVGRLKEVPGVFSQGETLAALEHNIRDAYQLMKEDAPAMGVN
jgi:predicted RNase H-like HicB family nuclease